MTLRTRISLIVLAVCLILSAGVFWADSERRRHTDQALADADVRAKAAVWARIVETTLFRLENRASRLVADPAVVAAIDAGDVPALAAVLGTLEPMGRHRTEPVAQVLGADGAIRAARPAGRRDQPILDAEMADIVRGGVPVRSVLQDADREVLAAVALPVGLKGGTGIVVVGVSLAPALLEFKEGVEADAFLANRRGVLLGGTDPALWRRLNPTPRVRPPGRTLETVGEEVFAVATLPVRTMTGHAIASLLTARDDTAAVHARRHGELWTAAAVLAVLLAFLAALRLYLRQTFRPLDRALDVLTALARGDTSAAVEETGRNDEIGRIARSISTFRNSLIAGKRAERQQEKLRRRQIQLVALHQELSIAADIQQSILPKRFPERPEFALHALMKPAKAVGGDFYEFFETADGRFGVCVADVSDKGVPAALFMAISRTLIRMAGTAGAGPAACLAQANDMLAQDNDSMMFVTIFLGILDPATGGLRYANGGHNPPFRIDAGGAVSMVASTGDPALGFSDGIAYRERALTMAPGDTVFLYTDGVTEALTATNEEFGMARLGALLQDTHDQPVETLPPRVLSAVQRFAGGTPQSDDITCLALRFAPTHRSREESPGEGPGGKGPAGDRLPA